MGGQEAWYSWCQYTIDNVLLSACIIMNKKIYIYCNNFHLKLKFEATFKLVMALNPAFLSYFFLSPCLLLRVAATITQVGGLLSCVYVGWGYKAAAVGFVKVL